MGTGRCGNFISIDSCWHSKETIEDGGVQFHLYHNFASRENLEYHEQVLKKVIEEKTVWCENGIVKDEQTAKLS